MEFEYSFCEIIGEKAKECKGFCSLEYEIGVFNL